MKYELVSYLGEGGFGKVYRVKDRLTGMNRAMKIIHVKSTSSDHEKKYQKRLNMLFIQIISNNINKLF